VIIVSNTGPLIGLAKGEHLHILPRLAGLLLLAKNKGILFKIVPTLEMIRQKGYWISDEIIDEVKRLARE
jgi:predicted nucleic acid-binding protein